MHYWPAVLLLFLLACSPPREDIEVARAYVRPPVAGGDVAVGYLDIENHGAAPVRLVGARTPSARRIEIHTHVHDGDMMRMRKLDALAIAPGERVRLEPGGDHLMLFGAGELAGQGAAEVVLEFDDGRRLDVRFDVRAMGEPPS